MSYRALDLLTKGGYAPKIARREPFWRPKSPVVAKGVHTPAWSWESVSKTEGAEDLVTLDVNAAYLAAIASAPFAHGALERGWTPDQIKPGYYLVTRHIWQGQGLVDPLGTVDLPDRVWIAHPTLKLLQDVAEDGYMPAPEILEAYTADTSCRLRKWAERIRDDRAAVLERRDIVTTELDSAEWQAAQDQYQAIKDGYSMAVQMMRGVDDQKDAKSPVLRPDWYHTVHAQHAASTWRKAYTAWRAGFWPTRMGSVDEITFDLRDWKDMQRMLTPPFRIDSSGKSLGSVKIKSVVSRQSGIVLDTPRG